ncbi:MAG: hypothetical protein WBA93_24220 [Microcoleaceae cyanobacterium]
MWFKASNQQGETRKNFHDYSIFFLLARGNYQLSIIYLLPTPCSQEDVVKMREIWYKTPEILFPLVEKLRNQEVPCYNARILRKF